MNNQPTVDQYLTKSQIYEELGRHSRTLTDDLRKAIANSDTELLSLAQLRTQDGKIVEGVEVTANTWKELSDNKENPAWYLLPEFVEVVRKRKSKGKHRRSRNPEPTTNQKSEQANEKNAGQGYNSTALGSEPPLPDDPQTRAIVLEHIHFRDQKHANENKEMMKRVLDLVETNQQLQGQSNELFNQLQDFIKGNKAVGLESPAKNSSALQENKTSQADEKADSKVIDAEIQDSQSAAAKPERKKPVTRKKKSTSPKKKEKQPESIWKMDVGKFAKRLFRG